MDEDMRQRSLFDADWMFMKQDVEGAERSDFNDSDWRKLNLPHDWSIEGSFSQEHPAGGGGAYLPGGVGWYRKNFYLTDQERGKKVFVEFDGVYKNCNVWINGQHLGFHPYGYTSFHYDLSPYLNYDNIPNTLAVRVDNSQQPDSRWYTGSGIYRHVWLLITNPLHITHWGTYVTAPKVLEELACIIIHTCIKNEGPTARKFSLRTTLVDKDDNVVGTDQNPLNKLPMSQNHPINPGQKHQTVQPIWIHTPRLWSLDDPYLYRVHSELWDGERLVDEYNTPFGIREICFDTDQGFLLNGQRVKINGVCLHHDGGCVGAAVPERVWERRLEQLKEMGCNGIRTSHYPPAPEFLDMCDQMGFLVMDEAFDVWAQGKFTYGYHEYFDEWAITDLKSMLHRDRNHPCIVLWSVGNEIIEQTIPEGVPILKRLIDVFHQEDPTRPVTSACDNIEANSRTTDEFLELLDVVGYNYVDRWEERRELYYSIDRHRYPQRKMIGSENVSVAGIRGDYSLESPESGFHWPPYHIRMIRAELLWKFTRAYNYVAGDFMWTGIDYLGESRWPHKNSSCGPIDLCGFPKDAFYFYQSQWTDTPMLHLFPHWTWPGREGEVIPVVCYTNCDSVELFVNGALWGTKSVALTRRGMDRSKTWAEQFNTPQIYPTTADLHLVWDVPYQPGSLHAIGKKEGEVVCEQKIVTAGTPAQIKLSVDRKTIQADGRDVAHFTIHILDKAGNFAPTAENLIRFNVKGEGRLIGVDNGNPASHEPFQTDRCTAFNGLCLALVQSTPMPGKIRMTARAKGLTQASLEVNSVL